MNDQYNTNFIKTSLINICSTQLFQKLSFLRLGVSEMQFWP